MTTRPKRRSTEQAALNALATLRREAIAAQKSADKLSVAFETHKQRLVRLQNALGGDSGLATFASHLHFKSPDPIV